MRRRITVGIVAAVAALGIAACGGDDDEETSTTTEVTTETGATGTSGATGPEGEQAVNDVIVQGLTASGEYTEGEAKCLGELLSADFADATLDEVEDPSFLQEISTKYESEIEECEGQ